MKRLVIIVEGETEEGFVHQVLVPYLNSIGMYNFVQCFKLKHSHGGIAKYSHLKQDILNVIYEKDAEVSTMIDYYRLPSDFPCFTQSQLIPNKKERVALLERGIREDIEASQGRRFENLHPYIQLHEFESLVFSSMKGVDDLFEPNEYNRKRFEAVINKFPNPEDINNSPHTAPSMRLKHMIPGYDKALFGVELTKSIGMKTLLAKCPHFSEWVEELSQAIRR